MVVLVVGLIVVAIQTNSASPPGSGVAAADNAPASDSAPAVDTSTPGPWPPLVGNQYVLGAYANKIGCYKSKETLDKVSDAVSKHDDEGFRQLANDAVVVDPGAHVRVLGYSLFNGFLDLRIRSGEFAGRECWYSVGTDNGTDSDVFFSEAL